MFDVASPRIDGDGSFAGFIGSAVCRHFVLDLGYDVVVVDKLTYAGNLASLAVVADSPRFAHERVDICDAPTIKSVSTYRAVPRLRCSSPASRSTIVVREAPATRPPSTPRTVACARQSQPEPPWFGPPITRSVR